MSEKKSNGKKSTWILIAVLVLVIVGAAVLYPRLMTKMEDQNGPSQVATVTMAPNAATHAEAPKTEEKAQAAGPAQKFMAKDFEVYDSEGNKVKLSDFRGKPVVINFFASWCSPCKIEMPYFEEAYQSYGDKIEFMMVNLNAFGNDKRERAEALVADGGYTFPVYFDTDGSATLTYNIRSMPFSLFVSSTGEIVEQKLGAMRKADLDAIVEKLAAEVAE